MEAIDQLLHDAEHANSGIWSANVMGDSKSAAELREKRDRLIKEAEALDPERQHPSWLEADLG